MDEDFFVENVEGDLYEIKKLNYCMLSNFCQINQMTTQEVINACLDVVHSACIRNSISVKQMKQLYEMALQAYHILRENNDIPEQE